MLVLVITLLCLCLVANAVQPYKVGYYELDYTFTHKGNTTTMTGVRSASDSSTDVLMSGFTWINLQYTDDRKTNYGAFIYKGPVTGGGTWYGNFNYPSTTNATVTGTFFYGPTSASASGLSNIQDPDNFFQAVGDYETVQGGGTQYGLLFQGYLNGTGTWSTLNPESLILNPTAGNGVFGTIAHSTMGGLVVGNFNTDDQPNRFRAFVYTIATDTYAELSYADETGAVVQGVSITAYCIWHNTGTTTYSIAGGIGKAGVEDGFIVDWNSATSTAYNWRKFHHQNSTITHFQGMWPDFANQGVGYSFSANWVSLLTGERGTSFVYVSNITSPDRTTNNVNYYDYHYPNTINNSANSVYYNNTIAFFELENEIYAHGFVAQFNFSEPIPDTNNNSDDALLSPTDTIVVSVIGAIVGAALLCGLLYYFVYVRGAAAGSKAPAASGTRNPMGLSMGSKGSEGEDSTNF